MGANTSSISLLDAQLLCLPIGFKYAFADSPTASELTIASLANPTVDGSPSFEICLYNDTNYSSTNFWNETVQCDCSTWSFEVPVSNPNSVQPFVSRSIPAVIDFLPYSLGHLVIIVPDGISMQPWNLHDLRYLQVMSVTFTFSSYWPTPIEANGTNSLIPQNLNTLILNGNMRSLPPNTWSSNITSLTVDCYNLTDLGTVPAASAPLLQTISISGFNVISLIDFSLFVPNLASLTLAGSSQTELQFENILGQLSFAELTISGFQEITHPDFWSKFQGATTLWIYFDTVVSICPSGAAECYLGNSSINTPLSDLSLELPLVTTLPINFFSNLHFLSSFQYNGPIQSIILNPMTSLSSLSFISTNFGSQLPSFFPSFCSSFGSLKQLTIVRGNISALPPVDVHCTLTTVILERVKGLDSQNVSNLALLPSLNSLSLIDLGWSSIFPAVTCTSDISYLEITNMNIASLPACALPSMMQVVLKDNSLYDWSNLLNFLNASAEISLLDLSGNLFDSSIPDLAAKFPQLQTLKLSQNNIQADISNGFWPSVISQIPILTISSNQLFGSLLEANITTLPLTQSLDLSSNLLSGLIPLSLLCGPGSPNNLALSDNQFSGFAMNFADMGSSFNGQNCNTSNLTSFFVANNLISSIPDTWMSTIPAISALDLSSNPLHNQPLPVLTMNGNSFFYLNLSNSGFSGTLDSILPSFTFTTLDLSNNQLSGTLPPFLLDNTQWTVVRLHNNQFEGNLPVIPPSIALPDGPMRQFDVSSNQLNGFIPDFWFAWNFDLLDLSNNPLLSGSIPYIIYTRSNPVTLFVNISNSAKIQMCPQLSSHPRTNFISENVDCSLFSTQACNCTKVYPQCSDAITCPPTVNVPPSPSCIGNPPTPQFVCIGGAWTFDGNLSSSNPISIGGPTTVSGGVVGSAGIVVTVPFDQSHQDGGSFGFGSSGNQPLINITGCLSTSSIEVSLSQSDIDSIYSAQGHSVAVDLISQNANCTTPLSSLPLKISQVKSCKTVTVQSTTGGTSALNDDLVVIFRVDQFKCNVWWIALVSVLSAVIILLSIGTIIWFLCRGKICTNAGSKSAGNGHSSFRNPMDRRLNCL